MPRDGVNGQYTLPSGNPVQPDTVIESIWANTTMQDIGNALTQSIAVDGQTVATANLPMGGFRHTNISDPSQRNQYASLGMVQDGTHQRIQNITGVDNLAGTLVGGATVYVAGALVSLYAPALNTGPMTLSYNGIGARSLVNSNGLPLGPGEIVAGGFYIAIYTGTVFRLLSAVSSGVSAEAFAVKTSGQERPPSGTFPSLTIATGTTINIPAGTAWIVAPDAQSSNDAVEVTWAQQTISLSFLLSSFSTTIAVDINGQIVQFPGRAIGANLRNHALLGVVQHLTGVASSIVTKPMIFGDDLYRGTDLNSLLTNVLISGGLVTGNSVSTLQLDVSQGTVYSPGADSNTADEPNFLSIPGQQNIPFRTLAGQNTVGGSLIQNAPVSQYDPNGAGIVTTIPNNADTVVHRLYYLYGSYVWVFGQFIYSSVENACSLIEVDRTRYKPSLFLADATLLAEIVSTKNASSLTNIAQAAIIAPGGINFSIGSPGGISEAPINGTPYGRQDAGWVSVLGATSPAMLVNAKITGTAPSLDLVLSPVAPGTMSLDYLSNTFKWASVEVVNPDDKMYIRSFDPANGNLRFTTTYDLATGAWAFPGGVTATTFTGAFSGTLTGNVVGGTVAGTHSGDGSALTGINHATLSNLTTGDPHTQYLNQTRGDARYPIRDSNFTNFAVVAALPGLPDPNTIYFVTA